MTNIEAQKRLAGAGGPGVVRRMRGRLTERLAVAYATLYSVDGASRIWKLLPPELRREINRDRQLSRRQEWERETFGRVLTIEWSPACRLDTKYLTT